MDVIRFFLSLLCIVTLCSCGDKNKSTSPTNKVSTANCADQSLKNEKIVRFKNGKISRIILKNESDQLKKYVEKNKERIAFIEDNYKLSIPRNQSLQLLGWEGSLNWGTNSINAQELWSKNIYGDGVVVAVIDSGIDTQHPQLRNQLYSNPKEIPNGIDDDGNGLIDDIHGYDFTGDSGDLSDTTGHGTHVSGIIAADPSQGTVKGVAPHAKLLMYDFIGPSGDGTVFDAIKAIQVAAASGARVINASWGGPACSLALKGAIDDLSSKNVLFITAAGNDSQDIDSYPSYPASFKAVAQITVGAMTEDKYTAGFSNYGKGVHLVAPGAGIISTVPSDGQQDTVQSENGTSMATPFVSGAAALLMSAFPNAKASDIKAAIVDSTQAGPYPVLSRGALDVSAAYNKLLAKFPN